MERRISDQIRVKVPACVFRNAKEAENSLEEKISWLKSRQFHEVLPDAVEVNIRNESDDVYFLRIMRGDWKLWVELKQYEECGYHWTAERFHLLKGTLNPVAMITNWWLYRSFYRRFVHDKEVFSEQAVASYRRTTSK